MNIIKAPCLMVTPPFLMVNPSFLNDEIQKKLAKHTHTDIHRQFEFIFDGKNR
jgi:hypothetical protein